MRSALVACALLVTGSAVWSQDFAGSVEPAGDPNVRIFDAAPANAQSLGPVLVLTCGQPIESAKRRLFNLVLRQGGNGVSGLTCSDEGMSFSCWSRAKCDAVALNIPPPVIVPSPREPRQKKKKPARVATKQPNPAQPNSPVQGPIGAPSVSFAVKPAEPKRGLFDERFLPTR